MARKPRLEPKHGEQTRRSGDPGPISSAHPVARSIRPEAASAEPGRGSKAFFALASVFLAGTALWAFNTGVQATRNVPGESHAALPARDVEKEMAPAQPSRAAPVAAEQAEPPPSPPTPGAALPPAAPKPKGASLTGAPAHAAPVEVMTPPSEPAEGEPGAAATFDREQADRGLAAAAFKARGCRRVGDPRGVVRVQVTFAPSGSVSSVQVLGRPFSGSRTGHCVVQKMKEVTLPAFVGDPVTLGTNVNIR